MMRIAFLLLALLSLSASAGHAQRTPALGPRGGVSRSPDQAYLGVQGEFGPVFEGAHLAPSLDFGLGDHDVKILNADLRWYLIHLPETGLRFYGAAGPGLLLSPDTELGLNLTVGLLIPMKAHRRYNLEARFGLGDIPDLKLGLSVLFSL